MSTEHETREMLTVELPSDLRALKRSMDGIADKADLLGGSCVFVAVFPEGDDFIAVTTVRANKRTREALARQLLRVAVRLKEHKEPEDRV